MCDFPLPMKRIRNLAVMRGLLALTFAGVVFGAGCTQVQLAPDVQGQYKPGLGELQVFVDRDFATVYDATKRGMKDMNLFQTQDDKKVIEAELRGRDSRDTMVIVKIKEVAKNSTSVKIRYGVVGGNLAPAQSLFQAIQKHL